MISNNLYVLYNKNYMPVFSQCNIKIIVLILVSYCKYNFYMENILNYVKNIRKILEIIKLITFSKNKIYFKILR